MGISKSKLTLSIRKRNTWLGGLECLFLLTSLAAFGWCCFVLLDADIFQTYQSWRFDKALAQASSDSPDSYSVNANERTGLLKNQPLRKTDLGGVEKTEKQKLIEAPIRSSGSQAFDHGLIGRLIIPRIGLSAMVVEGVDPRSLRRGLGHIPGTALPGETGNLAIAGHRDTFFRRLQQIRRNDTITLTTVHDSFHYIVQSMEVVGPDDIEVLRNSSHSTLTLLTCYPFGYIGPAPRRFVVSAVAVSG